MNLKSSPQNTYKIFCISGCQNISRKRFNWLEPMWGNLILKKSPSRKATFKLGYKMIHKTQKQSPILGPQFLTKISWLDKPCPMEKAFHMGFSNKNLRRIMSKKGNKLIYKIKRTTSALITCWSNKIFITSNSPNSALMHVSP